jgi:uncharacterized membrane protein
MTSFFNRTISSDAFDTRLGQGTCFVASIVVLVVSFWKLTQLDLTETQVFFGLLLSFCTPLLLVIIGLLLPGARSR